MENMEFSNLTKCMLEAFPELRKQYEEEMEWLSQDLQHVIFDMVFTPYVLELLQNNSNNQRLKEIFQFLELMANNSDERVQEVLVASVLESLVLERDIINIAKNLMGKMTLKMFEVVEREEGWEQLK